MSAIVGGLSRLVRTDPHRPVIHVAAWGQTLDAADLHGAFSTLTDALGAAGLRPGQAVVSAAGNRPSAVALLAACRARDLALLAADPGATPSEISELVERFGAAAVVAHSGNGFEAGGVAVPLMEGLGLFPLRRAATGTYPGVAFLKLTSGSTGSPKATLTTEAQLVADARHIIEGMAIREDEPQMAVIPLSHSYGLSVLLLPLVLQGTPLVLRESFVPHQLMADARRYGARRFPGVPFMFQHFVTHPPGDGWPPGLTRLTSAGARLPPEVARDFHRRFGVKIHSFYGTSETGGIAYDHQEALGDHDAVGWPLPGVRVSLSPEDGAPEDAGRIHVASDAVSSGYALDENGEDFRDGGFMTGDYGELGADGRLRLTGRVSSFVNVAGKKVQPLEVEQVLRHMPHVRDVRVVAGPDPRRGQQVVACIVPDRPSAPLSALDVRRFCSARLAAHKIPRAVVLVDALPTTARGKIDRRALEELVRTRLGY